MKGEVYAGSQPLSPEDRRASAVLGRAAFVFMAAPMVWVSFAWMGRAAPFAPEELRLAIPLVTSASLAFIVVAGLLLVGSRVAYAVLAAAFTATVVLISLRARQAPAVGFVSACWAVLVTYLAASRPGPLRGLRWPAPNAVRTVLSPGILISAGTSLGLGSVAAGQRLLADPLGAYTVLALLGISSLLSTWAEWILFRRGAIARWKVVLGTVSTALALGLAWLPAEAIVLLALRQTVALVGAVRAHESYAPIVRFFWHRPALLVVLTFLALGLGGGLVLTFPVCSTRPISGLDALFTAVSACCVTGLTVLDTPVDCTFVGQLVILALIQAGGLGIMTLAAIAVMILGGALPSEEEAALGHVVGTTTPGSTARLVRVIALGTFCVEVVGAAILLPAFLAEGSSFLDALWKAVFHAVSAFCNAGFALHSASLIPYQDNPVVIHTIGLLIVIGGIGFGVLVGIIERLRGRSRRLSLYAMLPVSTTAVLLVGGAALFLCFEWNSSLGGMSVGGKIQNAWFQSITPRTAGFNSVSMESLQPATEFLLIVLMFIGASPISTGGGIKTTTAAVLVLAVRAVILQAGEAHAFGRRIPAAVLMRASIITVLSLLTVVPATMILLATQELPFDSILFEVVSAFGTVGLSLGATAQLDSVGKIVIIAMMLVGRTGPLTLVLLFQRQGRPALRYPSEEVIVG